MSNPSDDHRSDGFDDLPGADAPPYGSPRYDAPDQGMPQYGADAYGSPHPGTSRPGGDAQYSANPYASDLFAAGSYGANTYSAGQPGQYPGPYPGQPYGAPGYPNQPYAGQPFGMEPYGPPAYGAMQPYGQFPPAQRKDPALMLVASLLIPGLGTILNGETGKGVGILAGYVVGAILSIILIGLPIMFGFWIWGMVDAYKGAQDFNRRHGLP